MLRGDRFLSRRIGVLSTAIALVCATEIITLAGNPQQTPPPAGTFRSRVTLVPVDVRVLDREGRPVTDLKPEDFTVLEDGVRQEIRHFSQQGLAPQAPAPGQKPALRRVPTLELAPQSHRTFLIVLGRGRLQEPSKGLTATIRFVREQLLPQDQVAVLAFNRATDFTTRHAVVAAVLERFRNSHERIEALLAQRFSPLNDGTPALAAIYGADIPRAVQALIDEVFLGAGGVASRILPPARVSDAGRIDEDRRKAVHALTEVELQRQREEMNKAAGLETPALRSALDEGESEAYTDLSFGTYVANSVQTLQDLQNIYAGIQYMRYLEGEKHLVFVSEQGLFLPRLEDDNSLAAMANDARVAIDTIQTGGLWSGPPPTIHAPPPIPGPSFSHMFAIRTLKNVSELTGGQASVYAYADPALTRINRTTLSGYLLGYYPSNSVWDGRYRRISVKVNRPGVTVLFRHGYYGREVLVPFDREAFLSYSRIVSAVGYQGEVRDIKVVLKASVIGGRGKAARAVFAEVKIDPARIAFEAADDRHQAVLDIAIFCGDAKGDLVGEAWQTMTLNLKDESYQRVMQDGLTYTKEVAVKAAPIYAKAVVYDRRADLVGSTQVKLR